MARPGDDYADLALAVLRGALPAPAEPAIGNYRHLRREVTIELDTWARMINSMLGQLAEDASSRKRALYLLGCDKGEISAWLKSPLAGMGVLVGREQSKAREEQSEAREGAVWLRRRRIDAARPGDDYSDLVGSARSFRLRGSGKLDAARLRAEYRMRLQSKWGAMVIELLAQVVADAGSLEYAATILEQPLDQLWTWVLVLTSRGDADAARSTWPVFWAGPLRGELPYSDLAEAAERGTLKPGRELGRLPESAARGVRELYSVRLAPWVVMEAELLLAIVADAGSIRKAAEVIDMPRSTMSAKLRRYQELRG